MLHCFNVFRENDGKENCAQLLEEQFYKMFGMKTLNDEHDCNVVTMISMNNQNANDDCTSHDKNVSYKHVNFCGVERLCVVDLSRQISLVSGLSREANASMW